MTLDKIDFRKSMKALYNPAVADFALVDVPEMRFLKVDGHGDPNSAPDYAAGLNWLYSVSYALKFESKAAGQDYTVPPLEALWWADDMADFANGRKDRWRWTQMIMVPDFVTRESYDRALAGARKKLGTAPPSLRLESFHEGLSVQILHIGPYDAEAPTITRLHETYLPTHGLTENGQHHEIYLSDPRRTAADKLKTIIRQPVRRNGE
jgi:hypothetical protein